MHFLFGFPALEAEIAIKFQIDKSSEGFIALSADGLPVSANAVALTLLGYDSFASLAETAGVFLSGSHIASGQQLADIIPNLGSSPLIVSTTCATGSQITEQVKTLNLQFIPQLGSSDETTGYLVKLTQAGENKSATETDYLTDINPDNASQLQLIEQISRELRTPLNDITGISQLLRNTQLNPQQQRYLHIADVSALAMTETIENVLKLARIKSGEFELNRSHASLGDVTELAMQRIAPSALNKKLNLFKKTAKNVPDNVAIDQDAVSDILVILLENAVKFTEQGTIELNIELLEQQGQTARIQMTVRDTGCGMTEEKIAELSGNGKITDDKQASPSGLGMTLCQELVKLLDGTLDLHSAIGIGSEISVTIPVIVEASPGVNQAELHSVLKNRKILALDDNHISVEYLTGLLSPYGASVFAARTGDDALRIYRHNAGSSTPIELLLIENQVSDTSAVDLIAELSNATGSPVPPVVIITTQPEVIHTQTRSRINPAGVLGKPVRSTQLFQCLTQVFRKPEQKARQNPVVYYSDNTESSEARIARCIKQNNYESTRCEVIPIERLSEARRLQRASGIQGPNTDITEFVSPLVLIVEDNPVNLLVVEETLQGAGYRTDAASNGGEALERIKLGDIDLVLMDCEMPVLDGFAATRRIRTSERERGILIPQQLPIVALTAQATRGDREKCLAAGMNDYISKPFKSEALFEVLYQYIGQPPAPDTGHQQLNSA